MLGFQCLKCGESYSTDFVNRWGTTRQSDGYGPSPRCTRIVTDVRTKAGEVCGGVLVGLELPDDTPTVELGEIISR